MLRELCSSTIGVLFREPLLLYPPLTPGIPTLAGDFPTIPKGTLRVIYRRLRVASLALLLEQKAVATGLSPFSATSLIFPLPTEGSCCQID